MGRTNIPVTPYIMFPLFRNGVDTDNMDESHLEEEVVEFLVKEEETVVQD
jgi:hypothetical protein